MAMELLQNTTEVVEITPDLRCDSASVVLYSPSGTGLAECTATEDALGEVGAEVSAVGATPDVLTFDAVDNILAGRDYWYASIGGWGCKVRVSEVDATGKVVTFETPPRGAPAVGDVLQGLMFAAEIPGASLATRDTKPHRLDWTMVLGTASRAYRQAAYVVGMKFRAPSEADDVARIAYQNFPSWARTQKAALWTRLAEQASQRVRQALVAREDYPWLLGDQNAFRFAGEIAARIELGRLGRVPPGNDAMPYVAQQETYLAAAIREAVAGAWVDRDDDRVVGAKEVTGIRTIRIERV